MVSAGSRTPFVYWAQDEDKINLRVDIQNSQEPKIDLSKDGKCIQFRAIGHSTMGNGPAEYNFQIHLSKSVKEIISLSSHENRIEIQLKKEEKGFWKNGLLSQTEQKNLYKWLKFDFEKWQDDPDEQGEEEEIGGNGPRQNPYLEKMLRELEEEKKLSLMSSEELAKRMDLMLATYLFVYNLGMFLIHFGALSLILFRFISTQKDEFLANFWVDHSQMLIALTCLQYLDVFNSVTGITKGSYKTAILQVSGRLFMLLIVNGCSSKCANWSAVPSLMVTYLLSEQFRYPHYALNSIGISLHSLVWLRYNAWLLLYPIGLTLEGLILLRSIPDYLHSGRYSLQMPNSLNFPFNFGIFLAIFTFICFPFIAFTLLQHMHRQRQKKMAEMGKGRNRREEKKAA